MLTIKEFKSYLPDVYQNLSEKKVEQLLHFFYKLAQASFAINHDTVSHANDVCIHSEDTYSHHNNEESLSLNDTQKNE
jgi:hypothetical protein